MRCFSALLLLYTRVVGGSVTTSPDSCTVTVRQIFPLGGPFTGNTAVTVTGRAFQDLGDVKCRFGVNEVQGVVVSDTRIECSSPLCSSPACVSGQEETQVSVPVEVSMNGVTFTAAGLHFTYYDMHYVAVSLLTPAGGPTAGMTRLLVNGIGLRDFTSGVDGTRMQGIKCKFGDNEMVPASKRSTSEVECTAPADLASNASVSATLHAVPLELTSNGYGTVGTLTASEVPYTYYEPSAFNTSWLHPLGGPMQGGTELHVYMTNPAFVRPYCPLVPPPHSFVRRRTHRVQPFAAPHAVG